MEHQSPSRPNFASAASSARATSDRQIDHREIRWRGRLETAERIDSERYRQVFPCHRAQLDLAKDDSDRTAIATRPHASFPPDPPDRKPRIPQRASSTRAVRDRQRNDGTVEDVRHGHLKFGAPCRPLFSRAEIDRRVCLSSQSGPTATGSRIVLSRVGYWPQVVFEGAPKRTRCWSIDNAARFNE
jgi:hypothetical protein